MIDTFIQTCLKNADKTAFVIKNQRISFFQLLRDVYRMVNLLKAAGLAKGSRALLLVPPSYPFYVLLFSCIYSGVNVVVPDSYHSFASIRNIMAKNAISHVLCCDLTALLCAALGKDVQCINVSRYKHFGDTPSLPERDPQNTVLTTFTSGTTGTPTPVNRTAADLAAQIEVVSANMEISQNEIVWANLPIYVLFVVWCGMTCIIDRRVTAKRLQKLDVSAVLASISSMLAIRGSAPCVKKLYCGGALLYPNEVQQLQRIFPHATAHYVYGATECVLMAKGTLSHYLAHSCALQSPIEGVELSFADVDAYGVGRICAKGKVVLTPDHAMVGGDLGYMDEHGLHVVGRAKYCSPGCYQYLTDMQLLFQNPRVKKGFSFLHEGKIYFCYQGRLSQRKEGIVYVRMHKIPMDAKHKTKPDYAQLIARVQRRKEGRNAVSI